MRITKDQITLEIMDNTVKQEVYPEIKVFSKPKLGKIRCVYPVSTEKLLMQSSDNLSTHDVVHKRQVYGKGDNLNAISAHYFGTTKQIIGNHFIKNVGPNMWETLRAEPILVEGVMRLYLTGSGWTDYFKLGGPETGAQMYGQQFRPGYRKNEKLDRLYFTPTGKGQVKDFPIPELAGLDPEQDDPKLTMDTILNHYKAFNLKKPEHMELIVNACEKLYTHINTDLESKDLLLADTKWEFGYLPDGTIILIDECVTPDSSRIWGKRQYAFLKDKNEFSAVQNDKQPFREYIESLGLQKDKKRLAEHWMADDALKEGIVRYCNIRENITGTQSELTAVPKKKALMEMLGDQGYL